MTTISGNSFMYVSTKTEEKLEDYDVVVKEIANFKKDIVQNYYIAVSAVELTHFSLLAIVVREPEPGSTSVGQLMTLDEGMSHLFTIQPNETINCGISLPGKVEFTVTVEHVEGLYYYFVTPVLKGNPVYTSSIPSNNIHLAISPQLLEYSPSNEFIVTVKAIDHPATVSISYSLLENDCKLFPLGKPITRSHSSFRRG